MHLVWIPGGDEGGRNEREGLRLRGRDDIKHINNYYLIKLLYEIFEYVRCYRRKGEEEEMGEHKFCFTCCSRAHKLSAGNGN